MLQTYGKPTFPVLRSLQMFFICFFNWFLRPRR